MATITGTAGNDNLFGTAGNDSISGLGGDDWMWGGAGNDTLDGGHNGTWGDFADYASDPAGVLVDLFNCTATDGFGGTDLVFAEHVHGSFFDDTLIGDGGTNWFRPSKGNDSVDGAGGSDVVFYEGANGSVAVDLLAGTASGVDIGNDTLSNIEAAHGGSFSDSITLGNHSVGAYAFGRSGHDLLTGGTGDNTFIGGSGNDTISGGAGFDALMYDVDTFDGGLTAPTGLGVDVNLATGTATDNWGDTDTFTGIEIVYGSQYDDTLTGGNMANGKGVIDGFEGFQGNAGDDTIDGGAGFDRVMYLSSTSAVSVTLGGDSDGGAQDGLGGTDVLRDIQEVRASDHDDTLLGSALESMETFEGRGGDDFIDGGGGIDRVTYQTSPAAVNVDLGAGTAADGWGGTDTLAEIDWIRGSGFDDTLTGDANGNEIEGRGGNDFISGGDGSDSMRGHGGNDTLDGGAGIDWIDYLEAGAPVSVNLATGTATGGAGNDTLLNIEGVYGSFSHGDTLAGDDSANYLAGSGGSDSIAASDGDDTLEGGSGNDTLDGGAGTDTAVFTGNFGDYVIEGDAQGGNRLSVSGPEGEDTLIDVEILQFADRTFVVEQGTDADDELEGGDDNDVISGRAGNDRIQGRGGDDYLDGGEGDDTMEGGEGNDTYAVDSVGDSVIEPDSILAGAGAGVAAQVGLGGGIDRVIASLDYALGNAIENLTIAPGAGALAGSGNALANILAGNESGNVLLGGGGNDSIDGGEGIDTAVYTGARAQYTVAAGDPGSVTANATGEGVDTLTSVERLEFSDGKLAVDLDGHAGEVAKIIGIVFGGAALADPFLAAVGLQLSDGGLDYEPLMDMALDHVLGAQATSGEVVTLLYTNLVGAAPDEGTRDFYAGWIDDALYTPAALGVLAADIMGIPEAARNGLAFA